MAASTITRDTWTNDSGTPTAVVGDGTLIGNTQLQNHIYARIDAMFAGAGAYATLTLGGLIAAEGFGTHIFSGGGTGTQQLSVRNTSAGTGNATALALGNDGSSVAGYLLHTSSTYTAAADTPQDGLLVRGSRVGGMSISATHASGAIRFYSGGSTERMRLDASGHLSLAATLSGTARRLSVTGAGEATTITDAGAKTGSILVSTTSGGTGDGGAIELGAGYGSYTQPYFAAIKAALESGTSNTRGSLAFFVRPSVTDSGLTEIMRITHDGLVCIGDIGNSFSTAGLTINQAAGDNEILTVKSSDVAHAFTTDTETDSYGCIRKNANTSGGMAINGYSSDVQAFNLNGQYTTGDTTKGGSSKAAMVFTGNKLNVNTAGAMGANENIVVFRDNVNTRHIFDADGDYHYDGAAPANYDTWQDVFLARALDLTFRGPDLIETAWDRFVQYNRRDLEQAGIVSTGGMVNMTKHTRMLNGCVWQLHVQIQQLLARVATLEATGSL